VVRADFAQKGVRNMETVEMGLREAITKDARRILERLYQDPDLTMPNHAGRPAEKCHPGRAKEVETLFGPITLRRNYFYNESTDEGRAPLDDALGLVNGYSPSVVRLSNRAAARMGFAAASSDLAAMANVYLDGRQIQRLVNLAAPLVAVQRQHVRLARDAKSDPIRVFYVEVDGTGVPMDRAELVGREGKQPDGTAKTREAKLGCVFTQTQCDAEGNPVRDYESTTYVGSFQTSAEFGGTIRAEACRRGLGRAVRVVFIGDGAAWIWELARVNFPTAVQILDLFHALERLHALCDGLYGVGSAWAQRMEDQWEQAFKEDKVLDVIAAARSRLKDLGDQPDGPDSLDKQIAYFENHHHRMLYQTYHKQGLFYGSGVIEAGCRAVIGQRLKQSGMFWSQAGAQSVLDLRCILMSNQWDLCWDLVFQSCYLRGISAA
jgi:hypothetical protein